MALRRNLLISLGGAGLALALATPALAKDVRLTAALEGEFAVSDNISDRWDAYLRSILNSALAVDTMYFDASANSRISYSKFLFNNKLDDFLASGNGSARIGSDHVALEGRINVSRKYLEGTETPATERPSGSERRVISYDFGPTISTDLLGLADLKARGSYGQVNIGGGSGSPLVLLQPDDGIVWSADASITTADRIRAFQIVGAGRYREEIKTSFVSYNGIGSLLVPLFYGVTAIGRGGYEKFEQPLAIDVQGLIWSAGLLVQFAPNSFARAETGERFEDTSWNGEVQLTLSPKTVVSAAYADDIQTQAASLILDLTAPAPAPDDPPSPILIGDLVPGTYRGRTYNLNLSHKSGRRQFSLTGRYSQRDFLSFSARDRTARVTATYAEAMSRRLRLEVSQSFERNTPDIPLLQDSDAFRSSVQGRFQLTRDVSFWTGYTWQKTYFESRSGIAENVWRVGISKAID